MQQMMPPKLEQYSSAYNIQEDNSAQHISSDVLWSSSDPTLTGGGGRRVCSPLSNNLRERSPHSVSKSSVTGRRDRSSPIRRDRSSPIRRGRSPSPYAGRRDRSPLPSIGRRERSPLSNTSRRNRSPIARRDYSPTSGSNNRRDLASSSRRDWDPLPRETPNYSPPWPSHSPARKRYTSPSPVRSYHKDAYRSSPRLSPRRESNTRRSKSPHRTQSAYHQNRRNASPSRKSVKSQSPPKKNQPSFSATRKNRRSPSPILKSRRSPSPARRNRRSPSSTQKSKLKSPSPQKKKHRSPSPYEKKKANQTSSTKSTDSQNSGNKDNYSHLSKAYSAKPANSNKLTTPKVITQYKSNLREVPLVSSSDIKHPQKDTSISSSQQGQSKSDSKKDAQSSPSLDSDSVKPLPQLKSSSLTDKSKRKPIVPINKKTSSPIIPVTQKKSIGLSRKYNLIPKNIESVKRNLTSPANSPVHKCKKRLIQSSQKTSTSSPTKSNVIIKRLKVISRAGKTTKPAVMKKRIIRKVIKAVPKNFSKDNKPLKHVNSLSTDIQSCPEESFFNDMPPSTEKVTGLSMDDLDLELEDISASEDEKISDLEDVSSASDQLDEVSDTELPLYVDENEKQVFDPSTETQELEMENNGEEAVEESIEYVKEAKNSLNIDDHAEERSDNAKDRQVELTAHFKNSEHIENNKAVDCAVNTCQDPTSDQNGCNVWKKGFFEGVQQTQNDDQGEDDQQAEDGQQTQDEQQSENDHHFGADKLAVQPTITQVVEKVNDAEERKISVHSFELEIDEAQDEEGQSIMETSDCHGSLVLEEDESDQEGNTSKNSEDQCGNKSEQRTDDMYKYQDSDSVKELRVLMCDSLTHVDKIPEVFESVNISLQSQLKSPNCNTEVKIDVSNSCIVTTDSGLNMNVVQSEEKPPEQDVSSNSLYPAIESKPKTVSAKKLSAKKTQVKKPSCMTTRSGRPVRKKCLD